MAEGAVKMVFSVFATAVVTTRANSEDAQATTLMVLETKSQQWCSFSTSHFACCVGPQRESCVRTFCCRVYPSLCIFCCCLHFRVFRGSRRGNGYDWLICRRPHPQGRPKHLRLFKTSPASQQTSRLLLDNTSTTPISHSADPSTDTLPPPANIQTRQHA